MRLSGKLAGAGIRAATKNFGVRTEDGETLCVRLAENEAPETRSDWQQKSSEPRQPHPTEKNARQRRPEHEAKTDRDLDWPARGRKIDGI
jgi:hypothetical protein